MRRTVKLMINQQPVITLEADRETGALKLTTDQKLVTPANIVGMLALGLVGMAEKHDLEEVTIDLPEGAAGKPPAPAPAP